MDTITVTSDTQTRIHHSPHHGHHQHHHSHGPIVEEIPSLLHLHKDGYVDRLPLVPDVPPASSSSSSDVPLHPSSTLWARLYAPTHHHHHNLPVLLYFHGGGFCVGSPSWKCYDDFLSDLSSRAHCAVASVAYRLAPEHRLPAAFDDGLAAASWLLSRRHLPAWWSSRCDLSNLFLAGDSAGATVAYHVALRLGSLPDSFMSFKGAVLIQPFLGGEERTPSERSGRPAEGSALTVETADAYWRMALPAGASRDHRWCNPKDGDVKVGRVMVCVAEMDVLRDRGVELCLTLRKAGKMVEEVLHEGVGHAFQLLSDAQVARRQAKEMVEQIRSFIHEDQDRQR